MILFFVAWGKIFRLSAKPLGWLRFLLVKFFILPFYGRYVWLKTKLNKRTTFFKEKLLLFLTNKYLVHVLLIIIALGVTTSNILAYEKREDYGQASLIYKLADYAGYEVIEEAMPVTDNSMVYSYQESGLVLSRGYSLGAEQSEPDVDSDNIYTDYSQNEVALSKPELIDTSEAKLGKRSIREYEVAEGDSVGKLAVKFNISVNTILWANNLSATSLIKPGQKLAILPVSGVAHLIVKGDTLSKIAQKYDGNEDKIKEFNGLDDAGALAIGEKLIIPDGRIIYTARPSAYARALPAGGGTGSNTAISATGQMIWPNGCRRISQYYKGWLHTGVDIACPWGTPILAADGGRIIRVQYLRYGYGYNVMIDHGNGKVTLYAHLSEIHVSQGQYVKRGQAIGKEGSTGRSTGPHLHFEVRVGGSTVNPLNYIR